MINHFKIKTKYLKNLNMDLYKYTWKLTAQVPKGRVTTYGAIAKALGDIRAARAVGIMEHVNPTPIIVPCQFFIPFNPGDQIHPSEEKLLIGPPGNNSSLQPIPIIPDFIGIGIF